MPFSAIFMVQPLSLASLDSSPTEGSLWRRDEVFRPAKASPSIGEVARRSRDGEVIPLYPSIASYPSGAVRPRSSQTALLYFLVTSVYSMGMVEMSASPFRILTAISPVV